MTDLHDTEMTGTISTARHRVVRYRAGHESGDLFEEGQDFDGLTLKIEVADAADAQAMLDAVSSRAAPADQIDGSRVAEAVENEGGNWVSCSGCHELNEGYPTGQYSPALKCYLGAGCRECGGIGAIWDTTDYAEIGDWLARQDAIDAAPADDLRATPERALAAKILAELVRARTKFPGKNVTFAALVEEVGELATATFEESAERVEKEAVQVAVMAMRMVLDGDHCFNDWRAEKGLDPLDPRDRAALSQNGGA